MQEIGNLISGQKNLFLSEKTKPISFRLQQLQKLKDLVVANREKIFVALYEDLNKSHLESFMTEYNIVISEIDYALKNLKRWSRPEKVKTPMIIKPASAYVVPEPFGVSLIISPWNYPFHLAILPAVGAISAGNTIVLKPSEYSTRTERLLVELINGTFDKEYFHVVTGGAEMAEELLKQKFDFIFFTGSPNIGKIVMRAAAENLTPICLELGGKNPCIVDESSDLEIAARRIVWGKFLNAGQTCVAPDYIYAHSSIKSSLIVLLKKYIREFYGANEIRSKDYGRLISTKHFDRLLTLMEGSKILYGGESNRDEKFIAPTLLDVASWDEKIMQEEIFGPILPILEYKDLDQILSELKTKDKALATYIFSENKTSIQKVTSELSFGGGCVNDCLLQFSSKSLPAGGVGQSGFGRYHGKYTFETFSHRKSIVYKSNFLDLMMRYPPYTEKKISFIKKLLKF